MERNSMKVLVLVAALLAVTAMVSSQALAGDDVQKCEVKKPDLTKKECKIGAMKASCGEKLEKISAALTAAQTAIDAGDTETASAKIAWAQEKLAKMKKFTSKKCSHCKAGKKEDKAADKAHKCPDCKDGVPCDECKAKKAAKSAKSADKGGFVNSTCPIMGSKIDPAKVTDSLTREFHGKKVALCCGSCPAKWDALSEADKKAKLKAAK